jgi:hypothetical protein
MEKTRRSALERGRCSPTRPSTDLTGILGRGISDVGDRIVETERNQSRLAERRSDGGAKHVILEEADTSC